VDAAPPVTLGLRAGRVAAFDVEQGTGTLAADGGERYFFHCVAIADGSRDIAIGTPVTFALAPGHLGRFEGAAVTPRGAAG